MLKSKITLLQEARYQRIWLFRFWKKRIT